MSEKTMKRLKKRYKKTPSDKNFEDPHQQRLFETSVETWGGYYNWISNVAANEEGQHYYLSLLKNYMSDKGLDFASLDDVTQEIFVEEWMELKFAEAVYEILKAEFDDKLKCLRS